MPWAIFGYQSWSFIIFISSGPFCVSQTTQTARTAVAKITLDIRQWWKTGPFTLKEVWCAMKSLIPETHWNPTYGPTFGNRCKLRLRHPPDVFIRVTSWAEAVRCFSPAGLATWCWDLLQWIWDRSWYIDLWNYVREASKSLQNPKSQQKNIKNIENCVCVWGGLNAHLNHWCASSSRPNIYPLENLSLSIQSHHFSQPFLTPQQTHSTHKSYSVFAPLASTFWYGCVWK